MISKKVTRYYSDCGRGFWKKQQALTHDKNCKCWKNPKFKSCISCKFKSFSVDSDGDIDIEDVEIWEVNDCENSECGTPIHNDFKHIRKNCKFHELKTKSPRK